MSTATARPSTKSSVKFLPREHGATAMLLTPIVCAAALAHSWQWAELATLAGAFAAMAAKDPLVLLLRERFVWKRPHADGPAARRWLAAWTIILAVSGLTIAQAWSLRALFAFALGIAAFAALAVWVNVSNKQRSVTFQIASALALTSTALATSLSAAGRAPAWAFELWILLAAQATAGILTVHARLDARIALRKNLTPPTYYRRAAFAAVTALFCASLGAAILQRWFIAAALALTATGYFYDLRRQQQPKFLEMPLKRVGQRALALASAYALLLIAGLWSQAGSTQLQTVNPPHTSALAVESTSSAQRRLAYPIAHHPQPRYPLTRAQHS